MADRIHQPLQLGNLPLQHRMVLAPLTRFRADTNHVPSPLAAEYYSQRACVPGTLLISEATIIHPEAGGLKRVPGLYTAAQISGWKEITSAVHARGSFIFCQLWALGRTVGGDAAYLEGQGYAVHSSSALPEKDGDAVPEIMTAEQIRRYVGYYREAARNAMEAGFDGVEIHGANGYLLDQFWQDVVNKREDEFGGSVENRARFGLRVLDACVEGCGGDARKVGLRLSPWTTAKGMKMDDPLPQFSYIMTEFKKRGPAYLHLIEARVGGSSAVDAVYPDITRENDKFVELWGTDIPIMLSGGYDGEKVRKVIGEIYTNDNVTIAFGRYWISTPDLAYRLRKGLPLSPYNRKTFYSEGPEGYIDYPFSEEWLKESRL